MWCMSICLLLLPNVLCKTFTMFCLFLTDKFSVLTLDPAFDDEVQIRISKMLVKNIGQN